MSTRHTSNGKAKEENLADAICYSFNHVIYDWAPSLSAGPQWKGKAADIITLKNHLDTRNWFPKEAKSGSRQRPALKSLLLTLNLEERENKEGIELLIGYLQDSRMKLLLSSHSVESFAQQLYQSGQTSKKLPLPSPLTESQSAEIQSIERIFATTDKQLSMTQSKVSKNNKVVQHEENMSRWGKEYEEVRRIWRDEKIEPTFIGYDVETYEFRHKELLEVGWSIVGPHREQETFHYIIEEGFYQGFHNGRHVPDYRKNFLFGKVVKTPLLGQFPDQQFASWTANGTEIAFSLDVGRHFSKAVKMHRRKGPVYIVFHDSKGDMKSLQDYGVDTRDWSYELLGGKEAKKQSKENHHQESNGELSLSNMIDTNEEDEKDLHPVYILDTQLLFAAIRCNGKGDKIGLSKICMALDVNGGDLRYFHNAANDAHYTAAALVKMAQGPHFTALRPIAEERLANGSAASKNSEVTHTRRRGAKKNNFSKQSSGWD